MFKIIKILESYRIKNNAIDLKAYLTNAQTTFQVSLYTYYGTFSMLRTIAFQICLLLFNLRSCAQFVHKGFEILMLTFKYFLLKLFIRTTEYSKSMFFIKIRRQLIMVFWRIKYSKTGPQKDHKWSKCCVFNSLLANFRESK